MLWERGREKKHEIGVMASEEKEMCIPLNLGQTRLKKITGLFLLLHLFLMFLFRFNCTTNWCSFNSRFWNTITVKKYFQNTCCVYLGNKGFEALSMTTTTAIPDCE